MSDAVDVAELQKMKVPELKKLLKDKGLSSAGNKSELIERLLHAGSDTAGSDTDLGDISKDNLLGDDDLDDSALDEELSVSITESATTLASPAASTQKLVVSAAPTVAKTVAEKPKLTKISMPAAAKPDPTSSKPVQAALKPETGSATNGKMDQRFKRFGVVSEDARKKARAERFESAQKAAAATTGKATVTAATKVGSPVDSDVLKKRSERFGSAASNTATKTESKSEDQDKLQKRALKFGTAAVAPTAATSGDADKLQKRAQKFGITAPTTVSAPKGNDTDRLLKRKARFGETAVAATTGKVHVTASSNGDLEATKVKRAARFGVVA